MYNFVCYFFLYGCSYHPTISDLVDHLQSQHNTQVQIQKLHFPDVETFKLWKKKEERRTYSNYVQQCAPQLYCDKQHWYYYCNRSGIYTSKTKGKRQLKTQGTCKLGERCIAHMKATIHQLTGTVEVQYCSTHHNHEVSLGHIRIPHETQMEIAAQLQQGVTIERIMDNMT